MRDIYTNDAIVDYYLWIFGDSNTAFLRLWGMFKCSIDESNDSKQLMMTMETGHA